MVLVVGPGVFASEWRRYDGVVGSFLFLAGASRMVDVDNQSPGKMVHPRRGGQYFNLDEEGLMTKKG